MTFCAAREKIGVLVTQLSIWQHESAAQGWYVEYHASHTLSSCDHGCCIFGLALELFSLRSGACRYVCYWSVVLTRPSATTAANSLVTWYSILIECGEPWSAIHSQCGGARLTLLLLLLTGSHSRTRPWEVCSCCMYRAQFTTSAPIGDIPDTPFCYTVKPGSHADVKMSQPRWPEDYERIRRVLSNLSLVHCEPALAWVSAWGMICGLFSLARNKQIWITMLAKLVLNVRCKCSPMHPHSLQ